MAAEDHPGWRLVAVLTAAVFAISSSAVLVRGMEAEPLAIAAWRIWRRPGSQARREYMYGRAATIYGGSNEVQRNVIAKAVLGL